ncbi:hypothetical protein NONI108955_12425 [Nocardia ninae]|uniref:Uncharacterized protein n=1 Tax=Nocardia ninae NBRC 108245 TaxID=1210091 RepID=A0A511MK25_9NOCA|nr:hypothetical protein [Nocardia ninae]GEM40990.1 hypothetical protein NN4_55090 [Nocardia ninae NBRC 108245]
MVLVAGTDQVGATAPLDVAKPVRIEDHDLTIDSEGLIRRREPSQFRPHGIGA